MRTTLFADGFHSATMTTYEDPLLRLVVDDNGIEWKLIAYLGDTQIDSVNLGTIRTRFMERIIAKTEGINIPVAMHAAGVPYQTTMLQEFLAETLETVKSMDWIFGPDNPANWSKIDS